MIFEDITIKEFNQDSDTHNLWQKIQQHYRCDEAYLVQSLLKTMPEEANFWQDVSKKAENYIEVLRSQKLSTLSIESFMQTYQLSSQEGLALMCLAEALLRIPDHVTKNRFIRDKIASSNWESNEEDPWVGKLTNWGMLTAYKVFNFGGKPVQIIGNLVRRFGEPLIRKIMINAVKIMGQQFVIGETIEEALKKSEEERKKGMYLHSFDMLGEGAKTSEDAKRYFDSYKHALQIIGDNKDLEQDLSLHHSLSVKLSALHPRYELAKYERVMSELKPILLQLAQKAKELGVALTIDAEESERLMLSLELFYHVYTDPSLKGWNGLGLAVQAYQKRASFVIDWLIEISKQHKQIINIRLVKGAYWDSEIKRTQERGLSSYAVFTRKEYTDVSYFHCAAKLLQGGKYIYSQFATHNAYTLAVVESLAKKYNVDRFEFQRLHGMGEGLYRSVTERASHPVPCRIYAPVGQYRDLLAYLVRRLLENGANNSFVHQIYNKNKPVADLIANPVLLSSQSEGKPHHKISLPANMLKPDRLNSNGIDLNDETFLNHFDRQLSSLKDFDSPSPKSINQLQQAVNNAYLEHDYWEKQEVEWRINVLEKIGNSLQNNMVPLTYLLMKEAYKTLNDSVAEVREAIDFCYYYAAQARRIQSNATNLIGPTGEINQLTYHGRGVFVCISPWNFPLAIFVGQIVAALVCGNCVIAKPASQTPKISQYVVNLIHQCGVPKNVLQLMITTGAQFSEIILTDPRVAGVAFTGSTEVAQQINQTLAMRKNASFATFIAETGGINAMLVDSSALLEQVVGDVITSAFQSAGQRCSALRLLIVQDSIADNLITMLSGAMSELKVDNPWLFSTDIGPVIDYNAKENLEAYVKQLQSLEENKQTKLLHKISVPSNLPFVAPQLWEIFDLTILKSEIFGPILHLYRFKDENISHVVQEVNNFGYGLTMGLHSRLESTINAVRYHAKVGNLYVNRNMIGAVVGVQPFGGEGFSGTGPKAGGPNYLLKFMLERTFTQDTTASGGNASLLAEI